MSSPTILPVGWITMTGVAVFVCRDVLVRRPGGPTGDVVNFSPLSEGDGRATAQKAGGNNSGTLWISLRDRLGSPDRRIGEIR
jgi:hypothetical protein